MPTVDMTLSFLVQGEENVGVWRNLYTVKAHPQTPVSVFRAELGHLGMVGAEVIMKRCGGAYEPNPHLATGDGVLADALSGFEKDFMSFYTILFR